jgi:hypothetical protein
VVSITAIPAAMKIHYKSKEVSILFWVTTSQNVSLSFKVSFLDNTCRLKKALF